LFFVDSTYHRRGIGRRLFALAKNDNTSGKITVNASPYALEVYCHLGFTAADKEQLTDGIRYTPMVFRFEGHTEAIEV
jgi:predicted GNAT family N-acyltransferase